MAGQTLKAILFFSTIFSAALNAQWTALNNGFGSEIYAMKKIGNMFIAATKDSGIFISTNSGVDWQKRNNGLTNLKVYSLAVNGSTVASGTYGGGVYISTDNGNSWVQKNSGLTLPYIYSLAYSGQNLLAGSGGSGVFISTNGGTNWNINLSLAPIAAAFHVTDTTVYLGIGPYFYRSRNNGANWTLVATANYSVKAFSITQNLTNTNLFVGTLGGVYNSTNNGSSWSTKNTGLTYTSVNCLAVSGMNVFSGTENGGVFLLKENATSWIQVNTGLPANTSIREIIIDGNSMYAASSAGVVWKRSVPEVTYIKEMNSLPNDFALLQNYPNPFNPTTTIQFQIPHKTLYAEGIPSGQGGSREAAGGFVMLKIYDALGREVATLVNEELTSGSYEFTFDGKELPSGIYFYKLYFGNFSHTKRMSLIK